MNPDHWQKIKSIVSAAIELAPEARGVFLNEKCSGDAELRREIESLLVFEANTDGSLAPAALDLDLGLAEVFADEPDGAIGRTIGRYRILRELGAGGMGVVYLAERTDGEFEQTAAIKLLRQGLWSPLVRKRFLQERQILARLRHPFIAQMLDGGTTPEGVPYLVMEYVEGTPVTAFVADRNLALDERLDLFVKICEAVAFAHRNLIVHRDLKPDNILIAADGTPKLLDFGIAKLLSDTAVKATLTRHQALTPEYAAPEQITGAPVTTATDIYCLGLVLYELLTGRRPFARSSAQTPAQILYEITQHAPARPSSVIGRKTASTDAALQDLSLPAENARSGVENPKALRGDLDNIVLKALKKEPERRYGSIEQFADDVRRYRRGEPVSVQPDRFWYRTKKLIGRNPFASAAALIALVSLVGGAFAAGAQARRAERERVRAEQRFNDVRRLANSLMFEINEEIEKSPIRARRLLVTRTIEYLDRLAADAGGDDLALQSDLAASYEKIGDVQSRLYNSNMGDTKGALASYEKALALHRTVYEKAPDEEEFGAALAAAYGRMGEISAKAGNIAAAVEHHRRAVEMSRLLARRRPENVERRRRLARAHSMLGQALLRCCPLDEVTANYRAARDIYERLFEENREAPWAKRSLATVYMYLGYALGETGETAAALALYRDALRLSGEFHEENPADKTAQNLLSAANWHMGVGLRAEGRARESVEYFDRAFADTHRLAAADATDSHWRNELADCELELGVTYNELGESARALSHLSRALENYEIVRRGDEANAHVCRQIAYALRNKADALFKSGRATAALPIYREAAAQFAALSARDAANVERRHDLAHSLLKRGAAENQIGEREAARASLTEARAILAELAARVPQNRNYRRDLAAAEAYLGPRFEFADR